MEPTWQTEDGSVRLWLGDCLDVLPCLEAGSVQAVIADPPYGIDYQSAWRIDRATWKPKVANDDAPFIWWLCRVPRLLTTPGALLCFCRWDVQEAFRLAIEWAGLDVKSQAIWDRESHGMGDLNGSFAPQHDVLWFAAQGRFCFPGSRPKSVFRSLRLGGVELTHPNEKPLPLMVDLVESVTAAGDLVCDPFLGSGSTAKACIQTGRRFVGCELDEKRFWEAVEGIQAELSRHPLLERPAKAVQRDLY